jgi:nitrate reductase NapE component
MKEVKFEYIFAFALLIVMSGALIGAYVMKDKDLINMILIALVGAFGSITAFFFTKHNPNKDKKDGGD